MPTPNQYKGTLIGSTIRPFSDQIKIATALSNEIKGGVHSVANASERNAILSERRQFGMLVYVIDEDKYYQLNEFASSFVDNNNNWRSVNIESVSSDSWRDNVIDYTGTQPGTPSIGDKYLVTNPITFDWAGNDTKIAEYTNLGWEFTEPVNGFTLKVDTDPGVLYIYEGDYPYGTWENYNLNPPIAATGVHVGLSGSQTVLSLDLIAGSGMTFNYVGKSIELQASGPQGPTGPVGAVFNESGNIEASSTFSNAKGGETNSVCFSIGSTVIGGVLNEARDSKYSSILGGGLNKIKQFNNSTILGGFYNCAYNSVTASTSDNSTIIGGFKNHICYSSGSSIISSSSFFNNNLICSSPGTNLIGHKSYNGLNIVNSQDSIVLGGYSYINYMCTSNCSVMLGGLANNMNYTAQSILIGGLYNCIKDSSSNTIIDGYLNSIIGTSSFISLQNSMLAGIQNKICYASKSTLISGKSNTIKGKCGEYSNYSSIISGNNNNIIYSNSSIIVGGATNSICNSSQNIILSGANNNIGNSLNSTILSSKTSGITESNTSSILGSVYSNIVSSTSSSILGGQNLGLSFSTGSSVIGGYSGNVIYSNNSTIIGGTTSLIYKSENSTIFGSIKSQILGNGYDYLNTIISSKATVNHNKISNSQASTILGHLSLDGFTIQDSFNVSVFGGYSSNQYACCSSSSTMISSCSKMCFAQHSTILAGYRNCIMGSSNILQSAIIAGYCNTICASGFGMELIIGGSCNTIIQGNDNSIINSNNSRICSSGENLIINGQYNTIYSSYGYNSIIGGRCISLTQSNNSMGLGGYRNTLYGCNSTIIGGMNHEINYFSCNSVIIGGTGSSIGLGYNSVILGGNNLTLLNKSNTVLMCCIGTNYGGSNFFGVTSSDITLSGITTLCVRNGLIVGFS